MLRRLAIGALVGVTAAVALWAYALFGLPDAPHSEGLASHAAPRAAENFLGYAVPASAKGVVLAVPVPGIARAYIRDSWGDPRDNGVRAHHGTDIMAPGGTPVIAAASGTVEKLWTSVAGGTTLYVRSPKRDWVYYYAHLSGYAPGLQEGQVVQVGDPLGFIGDTGDAGPGNFHLHFGLTRTTADQHWYQGQDVDPYPYLAGKPLQINALNSRG